MNSLRSKFKTSADLERKGTALEIGNTRITMARAGPSNKPYTASVSAFYRKNKKLIDADLMSEDKSRNAMFEFFADHIILDWETNVGTEDDPEWVDGIEGQSESGVIPFTRDNVIATFEEMPDLFVMCKDFAEDAANYRQALLVLAVKN